MKTAEDVKLFGYMVDVLTSGFAATCALARGDAKSYDHFKSLEDAARENIMGEEDE
jgi:hypothetical protein